MDTGGALRYPPAFKSRSRIFVLGHRGYVISVTAKDAEALGQATATRFLDSLRIGAVP